MSASLSSPHALASVLTPPGAPPSPHTHARSGGQCTQCDPSFFLLSATQCVADCNSVAGSQRYFNDGDECTPCHSSCEACSGPQRTNCVVCKTSAGYLRGGECVSDCGNEYYPTGQAGDALGLRCRSCLSGCLSCTNDTVCLECNAGLFLTDGDTTCAASCADGFGTITTPDRGGVCLQCASADCLDCSSQDADGCTQCRSGTLLHDGVCGMSCPAGTFPDSDAARCRPCDSAIPGCDTCNGDGSVCTACMAGYHQPDNSTCTLSTVCGAFEYELEAPTASTDRRCQACTLCRDGSYASVACTATADATCAACAANSDDDCGGASNGFRLYGTCTHDHDTRCDAEDAEDWPADGVAFVEVSLRLSNVPRVAQFFANGSLVDGLHARLVDALPALAPPAGDAPPAAIVLSSSVAAADTIDLAVRFRVDAGREAVRNRSLGDAVETLLTGAAAGALFGNVSDPSPAPEDVRPFLAGASTGVSSVSVALILPTFAPTGITITARTSDSVSVSFVDDLNPAAAVTGYNVYAQHNSDSTARATASLSSLQRSAVLPLNGRFPSGGATIFVSAVLTRGDAEDGRGPAAAAAFAVPSCTRGCLECSPSACITCDNSTGYFLPAGGSRCRLQAASSASSGSCISLGSSELCDATMYGFIVGVVVGALLLILCLYMCCTHKRVVMKEHEEAVADVYIRDAKFVPRWTQRDRQYRCVGPLLRRSRSFALLFFFLTLHIPLLPFACRRNALTQSRPLDARAVVALAAKVQDIAAEFKTVPKNEGYPDTVPPKAMRRVREPTFLPNMHSRVLLSTDHNQPGIELREFVNANFVRGHNGRPNAYIATQNPTREGVVVGGVGGQKAQQRWH